MKRLILLLSLALLLPMTGQAAAQGDPQPPVDDLIAKAKAAGKPLVIDFYAVWCKPCKKFKAETLPDKQVQAVIGDVLFHAYDAEKGNGKKAAKRYGVRGFPTFLVIDHSGKERARTMGFQTVSRFVGFVHQSKVAILDSAGVKRLLAAQGTSASTLLAVARWYRKEGDWKTADNVYQRAVKADPGNAKGVAGEASWECMQLQRYHRARAWIVKTNLGYINRFPTSSKAMTAFQQIALDLPKAKRDQIADKLLGPIMKEGTKLNSAVYFYLAIGSLDAALKAAKQQVALDPKKANPYDSLAEVHHYRGEKQLAIETAKKGIALVLKKPAQRAELSRNLKRFEKPGITKSRDVEAAAYRAKTYLAKLPGIDPVAQKLTPPMRRTSPLMQRVRQRAKFRGAVRRAFRAAGKDCVLNAGRISEVYVRLEFDDTKSKRAKKVVVLEPTASRKLKRCLVRSLKKADFVERPTSYKDRYTQALTFPKGTARLDAIMSAKKPRKKAKRPKRRRKK